MFKIEDVEKARKIVRCIDIPNEFGADSCSEYDTTEMEEQISEMVGGDFFITNGISKLVIVVEDLPFVIKIPFNGRWDLDEDSEYDGDVFYEFNEACEYSKDDYCACELEKTRIINDEGFGYFVPKMMYLCTWCGRDVYIQEKVKSMCDCHEKITTNADSLAKAKKVHAPFNSTWIALVFDTYGEEAFNDFMLWARECEPDIISDMHWGNYGLTLDGKPVMFDISGFRD